MHVHVHGSNGEAKFWLEPIVELADNYGLRSGELRTIRDLIEEHDICIGRILHRFSGGIHRAP